VGWSAKAPRYSSAGCSNRPASPRPGEAVTLFRALYDECLLVHTRPYTGVPEMSLHRYALPLAVLPTSRTGRPCRARWARLERWFTGSWAARPGQEPAPAGLIHSRNRPAWNPPKRCWSATRSSIGRRAPCGARVCLARYGFGFAAIPSHELDGDEWIIDEPALVNLVGGGEPVPAAGGDPSRGPRSKGTGSRRRVEIMPIDRTNWSGEGTFTATCLEALDTMDAFDLIRVEDAQPAAPTRLHLHQQRDLPPSRARFRPERVRLAGLPLWTSGPRGHREHRLAAAAPAGQAGIGDADFADGRCPVPQDRADRAAVPGTRVQARRDGPPLPLAEREQARRRAPGRATVRSEGNAAAISRRQPSVSRCAGRELFAGRRAIADMR